MLVLLMPVTDIDEFQVEIIYLRGVGEDAWGY